MIANDRGLDFEKIRAGLSQDYPRAADMPRRGFAAGPCLFKDTMQLAAFNDNNFALGHAAMLVNEGLPLYLVSRLERAARPGRLTVGILGMAFKAGSDDIRSSLSYKLKRILAFKAAPGADDRPVRDRRPRPGAAGAGAGGVRRADRGDAAPGVPRSIVTDKPVADVWNVLGQGVRLIGPPRPAGHGGHPGVQRGRRHRPGAGPAARGGARCRARCSSSSTSPRTRRSRSSSQLRRHEPADRARGGQRLRPRARRTRSGTASTRGRPPVVVVTMADGCDDPRQIDELTRLVERGVVVAAASRVHAGRPAGRRPAAQVDAVRRRPGGRCYWFARVGTRDATNSYKAYNRGFVEQVGIESRDGFEIGLELTAKARRLRLPVAEIPTIWLDRPAGRVQLQARPVAAQVPALVPLRLRPEARPARQPDPVPTTTPDDPIPDPSETYAVKTVLVSGSAGFIGGYVVEELLARGHEVVGIDNYSKYGRVAKSYDDHPQLHARRGRRRATST